MVEQERVAYYQHQVNLAMLPNRHYKVITANSSVNLTELVNKAIEDGYEPIGGVALCLLYDVEYWAQAIYRKRV